MLYPETIMIFTRLVTRDLNMVKHKDVYCLLLHVFDMPMYQRESRQYKLAQGGRYLQ